MAGSYKQAYVKDGVGALIAIPATFSAGVAKSKFLSLAVYARGSSNWETNSWEL